MPLDCQFIGGIETEHVNHRKIDPNDPEVLAVDLKITGQLSWEVLAKLLCCSLTEINNLWHPETNDENQAPRFPMQKKIELTNTYREHQLFLGDHKFLGVQLKKFTYEFRKHRRISLTFSATIEKPTDEEVLFFTHILKDNVSCSIGCDPDMFDELEAYENKLLLEAMSGSKTKRKKEEQLDMLPAEEEQEEEGGEDFDSDPLYEEAVAFVKEFRRATASSIQRKLKIGYNRSCRLLEMMEKNGVVSEMNSQGGRDVLIN
jgi:hypothetical protein